MKTAKLIELERDRLGLIAEARSILDEIKTNTDAKRDTELGRKHDASIAALDANSLDIDEAIMLADDDADRANQRPNMGGGEAHGQALSASEEFARAWGGSDRSGWADDKGQPVRVLRNTERFSRARPEGVALGDAVRAMITGPRNDAERRALSEGTSSAGGYTVPTPVASWFIDKLRANSVAIKAGAMTVPMTSETLAVARLATDPTIGWRAENATIASGDPTFERVLLTAKSLAGIVKLSRELVMDTVNAGAMIEQALAKAMALEIDRAAIFGDGTSDSPTGVINTSGINEVAMATNGFALSNADKLLDTIYEMALDNSALPTAMIMHPRTELAMDKLKDGEGMPMVWPDKIAKLPRLVTTAAPITETQGSASNASSIVFGDYTQLFIGMREDINVRVLNELYAANGQIALLVHARVDMQLAHAPSFSRLKGIIP